MRSLRLVPTTSKHDAAPPVPLGDPQMFEAMAAYGRALVRARFLQRPHDHLPHVPVDDAMTALGGRFTRRPWRRSA